MVTTAQQTQERPRQAALAFERGATAASADGPSLASSTRDASWQRLMRETRARLSTGLDAVQELERRRNASGQ